jgi:hypothetical protein
MTKFISFVIVPDCFKHNNIAEYLFQSKLWSFLSRKMKDLTKIYYVSDGATTKYKSRKNSINLYYHRDDFGMDIIQHFFAVSHGNGACDATGGTI